MNVSVAPAKLIVTLLALPALIIPAFALGYIIYQGSAAISWQFLTSSGALGGFGGSTGILGQLTGSLLLALGGCILATPIALGSALFYQLYASARQRNLLEGLLYLLQAIPPIVYGLFGLVLFVYLFAWGVSLLTGIFILAIVILPTLTLNTITSLQRIAPEYSEAARSLGLSDSALVARVWLRHANLELITGQLLAIARALSETAPILFTATVFSGVVWPESLLLPVTTLQTHIFYLAQEGGNQHAIQVAWGSALVLVACVTFFSLLARKLKSIGE